MLFKKRMYQEGDPIGNMKGYLKIGGEKSRDRKGKVGILQHNILSHTKNQSCYLMLELHNYGK